jgi:hypothetical protein
MAIRKSNIIRNFKIWKTLLYKIGTPSIEENKINSKYYTIPVQGGNATLVKDYK